MTRYRKNPVEVDAWQVGSGVKPPQWFIDSSDIMCTGAAFQNGALYEIKTSNGSMFANRGDYIIRNEKGEICSCNQDIFEQAYEEVE